MVGATSYSGYGVLNPAIGMATTLVMSFDGNTEGLKWFWIYLAFPFAGSIVGVLFHEFVYKQV